MPTKKLNKEPKFKWFVPGRSMSPLLSKLVLKYLRLLLDSKLIYKQNFYSIYSGLGQNTLLIVQNWIFLWETLFKKGWTNLRIVSHFRERTLYRSLVEARIVVGPGNTK